MAATLHLADIPSNTSAPSGSAATGASSNRPRIELRPFHPELPSDALAFRSLNEWWIEKYFGLEEHDREMLGDPEGYVLAKGGHIFFAIGDGAPIGCCGLTLTSPGVYEVVKMAVAPDWQGAGVGRALLSYTVEQGRALGASSLYLETNSSLSSAIHLYETLGFRHLPPRPSPYVRANVFMELRF
ncbi:MAG: GNAT family N-acetyltransferase [Acidobacteria bacterium]|nr:GNAT family N-acetyltransferase [Acidobacteriota bacterium]